jgi:sporulation protein YlmC with PRC-barrel domain
MKIILNTIAVSLLLILVGAGGSVAWAAKNKNPATNYPSLVAAADIKGTHVKNPQGQDLGTIDEVLIDPDTGQVRFVILEVGGFLGLGSTRVAVPLSAFQITEEGSKPKWVLDADKDKLKNAPKVEGKNYERLYTRTEAEPIFVYWRVSWVEPLSTSETAPASTP